MVTLISQFPNQFELHLRAILGLADPVDRADRPFGFGGDPRATRKRGLSLSRESPKRWRSARRGKPVDLRIFAKPNTLKNRRMGIALARGENAEEAVERAKAAAARVQIRYRG